MITMKHVLPAALFLTAIGSSAWAQQPAPDGADQDTKAQPAAAARVEPHNHLRDAKGIPVGRKAGKDVGAKSGGRTRSDKTHNGPEAADDGNKANVKPHSHPRDAKGM